jgi:2-aminoethylphosphonate-pyruvate transaminase
MVQMAEAHGIRTEVIRYDIFTPARPVDVEERLAACPDVSHVAVVHHETTTGLLNPLSGVAEVAARQGRRLIVDATSSLFGEPLDLTQDGIDYVTASATKCAQGISGVSFVLARRSALELLKGRPRRSVYLDLDTHYAMQEQDNTPFTPAVQVFFALRQALRELEQEGVDARIKRYAENARVLREGMARLGFDVLVPEGCRSNILTTFRLPRGSTYDALHDAMKHRGYIIYAGQGDIRTYAFRVANLGTLTPQDMGAVVTAFAGALRELGLSPR